MKTKTIEVWVSPLSLKVNGYGYWFKEKANEYTQKATITYEVEEPKIEITESQLREIYASRPNSHDRIESTIRKLFGEDV